ncbi:MAG: ferrous iron transport protein B [Verrucomicrobia bacterium]|nr:ferrous iron transport protein B [Verrucomicrobiota bacterium]MBI3867997.1 ferrous iron transport protein B [Verrucomicrobiota bacterium]
MSPTDSSSPGSVPRSVRPYVVLTGNPNCGKTTLFNALTGLRAKVGNYPGVTVERKEGELQGAAQNIRVLDLPGTYSLSPQSLDEQVARDVLFHRLPEVPSPALVIVVVDASNLQRNLYFATQVIELGYPTVIALNMVDVATDNGVSIQTEQLSLALGVPVHPIVASSGVGVLELTRSIAARAVQPPSPSTPRLFCELPRNYGLEAEKLTEALSQSFPETRYQALAEALLILSDERIVQSSPRRYSPALLAQVAAARQRLESQGVDWRSVPIEARYARVSAIEQMVSTCAPIHGDSTTDKIDRVVTDRVWGLVIFVAIMALIFQGIFSLAETPKAWIEWGVESMGRWVSRQMPPGPLNELIELGVFKGAGAVAVFLPQICLLFFFIGLLEDTGYMARAAFLMDRLMSKVGLHGKSFIPMLSSFACAIPGIMASRTIESPKDRLVTILVAPLMSCSARLPVYTLLIAACIPRVRVAGVLELPGLVMLAMYLLGVIVALAMAWLFKKTLLKGPTPMLILELPPYKRPLLRVVLRHMWDRSRLFLRRAGTVILGINILLWFLASYPKDRAAESAFEQRLALAKAAPAAAGVSTQERDAAFEQLRKEEAGRRLRESFAGRLGRGIEPLIRPLGFDWKIGIGIIASFAAREVFVSTMSLVYNVGELDRDSDAGLQTLAQKLQEQKAADGGAQFRPRIALALMVFYVFALQCVSTVAIVRRETNTWRWPLFQWVYMGALAWGFAFLTYRIAPWFGLS